MTVYECFGQTVDAVEVEMPPALHRNVVWIYVNGHRGDTRDMGVGQHEPSNVTWEFGGVRVGDPHRD